MATVRSMALKLFRVSHESNFTLPNLFAKSLLSKLGINQSSPIFQLLKKQYRRTGNHVRLPKSYSFNGEDRIVAKYLPEVGGKYLDIGSGHPRLGSNTFLFYKRGWSGITIDPQKRHHILHSIKRRRDKQVLACISVRSESKDSSIFYRYSADDYSTTSKSRYLDLLSQGIMPVTIREVTAITVGELDLTATPSEAFFLDIDIEGSEFEVLQSIDWKVFKPRVIAVEEWKSPLYAHTEIRGYLEDLGYKLESRAVITSIYVHSEYLELVSTHN
jgi:hypothetical protein